MFYSTFVNRFHVICNISVKEHLPEEGHNRQPKHVAGYAAYTTINLRTSMYTCWSCLSQRNFKLAITCLAVANTIVARRDTETGRQLQEAKG